MNTTMKNLFKIGSVATLIVFALMLVGSCTKKDPSIIKIFVRSESNALVSNARVVIIGDVNSDPPTNPYVDTLLTNTAGFAEFDMANYFGEKPKKGTVGYFDVIVKKDAASGTGRIRCRAYITNVETITIID